MVPYPTCEGVILLCDTATRRDSITNVFPFPEEPTDKAIPGSMLTVLIVSFCPFVLGVLGRSSWGVDLESKRVDL